MGHWMHPMRKMGKEQKQKVASISIKRRKFFQDTVFLLDKVAASLYFLLPENTATFDINIYISLKKMRKFTSLTVLAIIGSSDAFSSSTTTTTAAGLSAVAFEKKKTTTQLSLSSNLPDPKAELKTVNGSLLQDEEVPSASAAEAADITTTAVAAPSYGGGAGTGPLARVGDNDQQQQQPRQNKYNGLGGTAAPSKRRMVIGLQDIIKQQRNLNMHVYCNDGGAGDSKKTLNTEFTNFL